MRVLIGSAQLCETGGLLGTAMGNGAFVWRGYGRGCAQTVHAGRARPYVDPRERIWEHRRRQAYCDGVWIGFVDASTSADASASASASAALPSEVPCSLTMPDTFFDDETDLVGNAEFMHSLPSEVPCSPTLPDSDFHGDDGDDGDEQPHPSRSVGRSRSRSPRR